MSRKNNTGPYPYAQLYAYYEQLLNDQYAKDLKDFYESKVLGDHNLDYIVPVDNQTLRTIQQFAHTDARFRSVAGLMLQSGAIVRRYLDVGAFPHVAFVQNYIVHGRRISRAIGQYLAEILRILRVANADVQKAKSELSRNVSPRAYLVNDAPLLIPEEPQWLMRYGHIVSENNLHAGMAALSSIQSGEPLALSQVDQKAKFPAIELFSDNFALSHSMADGKVRTRALYGSLPTPIELLCRAYSLDRETLPSHPRTLAVMTTAMLSLEALRRQPRLLSYDLSELELSFGTDLVENLYRNVVERHVCEAYYNQLTACKPAIIKTLDIAGPSKTTLENRIYEAALERERDARLLEKIYATGGESSIDRILRFENRPLFSLCHQIAKKINAPLTELLACALDLEDENILWLDSTGDNDVCWANIQLG